MITLYAVEAGTVEGCKENCLFAHDCTSREEAQRCIVTCHLHLYPWHRIREYTPTASNSFAVTGEDINDSEWQWL